MDELLSDGPISQRAVLTIIHRRHVSPEDEIAYANSLLPGAGDYLPGSWWLRAFIKADLSDDDASREIERQRAIVKRICNLFPALIQHLKISDRTHAEMTLNIVFEACSDYPAILASGRKEANKKKLVRKIGKLGHQLSELNKLLKEPDTVLGYDFERVHKAYLRHVHRNEESVRPFWQLRSDLEFLSSYLELSLYRAQKEADFPHVPDNQAKTYIVDCAYGLALYEGTPPFVTTPGSDFSSMCSIIYEMATGVPDESLAGAINRFARSSDRAEADENELTYSEQRESLRDEDNFFDVKENAPVLKARVNELTAIFRDQTLSEELKVLIHCLLLDAIDEAERNEKMHGPFIMWASQMKVDWDGERRDCEDFQTRMLKIDIELGKLKRSKRRQSIDAN
ncbi:hypothetical protein [Mesorhizobium muleiense]|uniref:hypothetical protein n=1 Tax=Mesorhizobium muleiense TaxID=1004279 RepID=UPI001F36C20A|nr:hypothetical protein [Mesorhizobium muleiense]MCF6108666.1 hypothetical protein [Mesorhizobium muleiense]